MWFFNNFWLWLKMRNNDEESYAPTNKEIHSNWDCTEDPLSDQTPRSVYSIFKITKLRNCYLVVIFWGYPLYLWNMQCYCDGIMSKILNILWSSGYSVIMFSRHALDLLDIHIFGKCNDHLDCVLLMLICYVRCIMCLTSSAYNVFNLFVRDLKKLFHIDIVLHMPTCIVSIFLHLWFRYYKKPVILMLFIILFTVHVKILNN